MAVIWNSARTKVQLRLTSERIRALQAKLEAMQKADRKALTGLVEKNKIEAVRVRTEALINTDVHIELLELLELYIDTLLARFTLLENTLNPQHPLGTAAADKPEPALADALASVLYAAPQTELRELHQLREALWSRLPRDWALGAIEGDAEIVPPRILNKVSFSSRPPDPVLVDAYISEICAAYSVPFTPTYLPPNPTPPPPLEDEEQDGEKTEDHPPAAATQDGEGDTKEGTAPSNNEKKKDATASAPKPTPPDNKPATTPATAKSKEDDALADLEARFASLKKR